MISTIDLHVHTFYSDGRDAPEAVLRRAAALGIKMVAITDHDNTNGIRQVQALAREVEGVEHTAGDRGDGACDPGAAHRMEGKAAVTNTYRVSAWSGRRVRF